MRPASSGCGREVRFGGSSRMAMSFLAGGTQETYPTYPLEDLGECVSRLFVASALRVLSGLQSLNHFLEVHRFANRLLEGTFEPSLMI